MSDDGTAHAAEAENDDVEGAIHGAPARTINQGVPCFKNC
jgi:hypothetical protein